MTTKLLLFLKKYVSQWLYYDYYHMVRPHIIAKSNN